MSQPGDKQELLLLLHVKALPKLARICPQPEPSPESRFDPDGLRTALESGIKRAEASPESPEVQRAKEAELLAWFDARGGKDEDLHPFVRGLIRVARSNRGDFDGASESQIEAEKASAAAVAKAAKAADPVLAEVNALDETPTQPVIQRERQPRDIFEALDRQMRRDYSTCIGESFGSWRH